MPTPDPRRSRLVSIGANVRFAGLLLVPLLLTLFAAALFWIPFQSCGPDGRVPAGYVALALLSPFVLTAALIAWIVEIALAVEVTAPALSIIVTPRSIEPGTPVLVEWRLEGRYPPRGARRLTATLCWHGWSAPEDDRWEPDYVDGIDLPIDPERSSGRRGRFVVSVPPEAWTPSNPLAQDVQWDLRVRANVPLRGAFHASCPVVLVARP